MENTNKDEEKSTKKIEQVQYSNTDVAFPLIFCTIAFILMWIFSSIIK